jgi:hypothetical protein
MSVDLQSFNAKLTATLARLPLIAPHAKLAITKTIARFPIVLPARILPLQLALNQPEQQTTLPFQELGKTLLPALLEDSQRTTVKAH